LKSKMKKDGAARETRNIPRWIDLERRVERAQRGTIPEPVHRRPENLSARTESVALDRIEIQCLRDGALSALEPLQVRIQVHSHLRAGLRQPSPRIRKVRIERHHPLQDFDCHPGIELVHVSQSI